MDHTKVDLTPGEIVRLIERLNAAEDWRPPKSSKDCRLESETSAKVESTRCVFAQSAQSPLFASMLRRLNDNPA